jgi:hypothetical protein
MYLDHTILSTQGKGKFYDRNNIKERGRNAWRILTKRPFCKRKTGK